MISIVIPAYNVEKYISETLESVIAQSYKDYEVIIVDDCSTDGTVDIVREYQKKNPNIHLIQRKVNSGGCRIPRFDGILKSDTKFVCPIDADDIIEPEYIEKLIKRYNETKADIILGRMIFSDEKCIPKPEKRYIPSSDYNMDECFDGREAVRRTVGGWQLAMAGMLANTDEYKNYIKTVYNDGDPGGYVDEVDHRRFIFTVKKVALADASYFYRQQGESILHKVSIRSFYSIIAGRRLHEFICANYDEDNIREKSSIELIDKIYRAQILLFKNSVFFDLNQKKQINNLISATYGYFKKSNYIKSTTIKRKMLAANLASLKVISKLNAMLTK